MTKSGAPSSFEDAAFFIVVKAIFHVFLRVNLLFWQCFAVFVSSRLCFHRVFVGCAVFSPVGKLT